MDTACEHTEKVRAFWNSQASQHAGDLLATTPDSLIKGLEIDALRAALDPSADTIEVGCGNGYNLLGLADFLEGRLVGVDYAPEMIKAARQAATARNDQARIRFMVGDVLGDLDFLGTFGQVFTDRCLINLPSLDAQVQALDNLRRLVRPGGRLVLIECAQQAQERLNELRRRVGLTPIPYHWHNVYLDEEAFLERVPEGLVHVETRCFSSLYYVISRVFNAKLTPEGRSPDYLAEINKIACQLPSVGDYGLPKLFLFQRRS